jgi:hypothetical protein
MENAGMAKNRKLTMKQLMGAVAVLVRFLDEYQTVNPQNSDEIVEYEEKVARIAIPLSVKKYDRVSCYSLVDLLLTKGKQNVRTINLNEEIMFGCDFLPSPAEDLNVRPKA